VHSLCPTIYGHELVKAGMLLALFGGVRKNVGHANRVPIRGGRRTAGSRCTAAAAGLHAVAALRAAAWSSAGGVQPQRPATS
jgi:hypothetical protein